MMKDSRITLAGNQILSLVTPDLVTPVERVYRRNPLAGTYTATPSRPFTFELGAFTVPKQKVLVVLDYRFGIYVPSGIVPGDVEELQDRRLSVSVGWDFKIIEKRDQDLAYQLEPIDPALLTQLNAPGNNPGFIPGSGVSQPSPYVFQSQNSNNFASATGSALSTQPQRHRRDAQLTMPFTYAAMENQRVNLSCVVFRPIPIPVAFFESEFSGFLMDASSWEDLRKRILPMSVKF